MNLPVDNLGAARLVGNEARRDFPIELRKGDDLLLKERPGIMKVDTEGHELSVLKGVVGLLKRHHPALFVELENGNRNAVDEFLFPLGYRRIE